MGRNTKHGQKSTNLSYQPNDQRNIALTTCWFIIIVGSLNRDMPKQMMLEGGGGVSQKREEL